MGDLGSISGSGSSPGEGNGNPLQDSCLENPKDGGAWWATVHGVAKSRTRLNDFTFTFFHFPLVFLKLKCAYEPTSTLVASVHMRAPLCPLLYNSMDRAMPGSSIHGILKARILEWVAISFSRGSSRPRDRACISHISCIGCGCCC